MKWRSLTFLIQVDSLMGATIQQTHYSEEKRVILQDGADINNTKVISGINVLTNNQVCRTISYLGRG